MKQPGVNEGVVAELANQSPARLVTYHEQRSVPYWIRDEFYPIVPMETIYEWLLSFMGKEEKYYTILNAQRHDASDSATIEVLARTKDFRSIAMLIHPGATPPRQQPDWVPRQATQTDFLFDSAHQVVNYLETGEGATLASDKTGIHLILIEPEDDLAPIAFD